MESSTKEANIADWDYKVYKGYVLLLSYRGNSKDIVVPNEIYGMPTRLKSLYKSIPQIDGATSFTVLPREDGTKVGIVDSDLYCAFGRSKSIKSINLSGLDTSTVEDMGYMFADCINLTSLDISGLDTSQVTDMQHMFSNCSSLTSLDISSFKTTYVRDMGYMFYNCASLTSLNLSNFDSTINVRDMSFMFSGCSSLTSLDVSNFDTSYARDMSYMFNGCASLTSLNLSNFNMCKINNMREMFANCPSLAYLDLSSFNTSQVSRIEKVFYMENGETKGLLIKTRDSNLLNDDFKSDNRIPIATPSLDADGGKFIGNGQTTKQYFTKVAYTPEEFEEVNKLTTFMKFQEDNIPMKAGTNFRKWKLLEGNDTGAQNVYPDLYGAKYQAQWGEFVVMLPLEDNISKDNTSLNDLKGINLGLGYWPGHLKGKGNLLGTDKNRTPLTGNSSQKGILYLAATDEQGTNQADRIHVGVKDSTVQKNNWSFQVNFSNESLVPGISLFFEDPKLSENDKGVLGSTQNVKLYGSAPSLPGEATDGHEYITVPHNSSSGVMMADNQRVQNGVYDFSAKVGLLFDDNSNVSTGEISGKINWSLNDVPVM